MNKNKKISIILFVAIIIIFIIIGSVIFINKNNKNKNLYNGQNNNENISETYKNISESKQISFTKTIDENNKIFIAIKDNYGYKEITTNGEIYKYIVKNGDTYYLDDENKMYYKYQSNTTILTEIKEQFEDFYSKQISKGKDKIEGKTYNYEEATKCQSFLFNQDLAVDNLENATTRLYYSGDELKYIKTIINDKEEIMKIDISYNVNDTYFDIPNDYVDGRE